MTKIYVERDSDVNFLNHVNFLAVTNYEARAHYFFTFIRNLRAIRNDLRKNLLRKRIFVFVKGTTIRYEDFTKT